MHRLVIATLTLLVTSATAAAQWSRVDMDSGIPAGLAPAALAWDGSALYSLHLQTGPAALRMFTSTDAGASWTEVPDFPGTLPAFNFYAGLDGRLVVAGITNDGSHAYFRLSDDGGSTWNEVLVEDIGGPSWVARRGSTMFAATTIGVAVSTDDGNTWQMTNRSLAVAGFVLTTGSSVIAQGGTGTFRSADDGATWTQITIPGTLNLFNRPWVDDGVLYMKDLANGTIHSSADEGVTWTSYTSFSAFDYTTVLVQPGADTWIPYAVAVGGANFYTSTDMAVTAKPIDRSGYPLMDQGQPCFAVPTVSDVALFVTANLCFNANNGIYRHLLTTDTAVQTAELPSALRLDAPYPNPTTGRTRIPIELQTPSMVKVRIIDSLGRTVRMSTMGLPAGAHDVPADLSGLTPGAYGISVVAERAIATKPIILID